MRLRRNSGGVPDTRQVQQQLRTARLYELQRLSSCTHPDFRMCYSSQFIVTFTHTSSPPPLSQIGVDRMARGSSFEGDRAVSVAAMMMCDLKLPCSKTAMLTGAKCKRCCALFDRQLMTCAKGSASGRRWWMGWKCP